MNNLDYSGLELSSLLSIVAGNTNFEASRKAILSLEVSYNPLIIKRNINMTKEAMQLLNHNQYVNFYGIEDVREQLLKASKGVCLSTYELLLCLNFHKACQRIKKAFEKIEELDLLKEYSDAIDLDNNTFNKIDEIIDSNGNILKTASLKLESLYEKEDIINQELNQKAKTFIDNHNTSLQEQNIFYRDDRLSFLLKNSDKYKYDGLLHGQSSSGQASYVEPKEFVDLNNSKIDINDQKDKEIEKILVSASFLISKCASAYIHNFETLIILDGIFAKARYGYDNAGVLADISHDKHLLLENVAHPLIDAKKVVSNTYELSNDYKGILISGANTGGKTVSLKVIGLSIIMSYLGIPLLASKAIVPLYDGIYIDIDDNQSLESSLSTFSSQLVKLNEILNLISKNSLVLVDELGNGTDPKQAQALSIAIVDKFLQKGADFVLTTHFDELKNYALNNSDILVSSVSFDEEKLMPTYHYIENSVGSSNALRIASFYLNDKSIVDFAYNYLNSNISKEEEMLKQLEEKINENEQLQKDLELQLNENEKIKKDYENMIKSFKTEKEELLNRYKEELNEQIEIKIAEINKLASSNLHNKKEIVDKIKEHRQEIIYQDEAQELSVGDNVRINDSEQIGQIVEISGNNAVINLRGMKIRAKLKDLKKMPKTNITKTHKNKERKARVNKELVLIGMRVEEALPLLEKYLDDAYAAKMSNVRIIHGIGTGILRKAVHERLKKTSFVKNYHLADYYDGGSAITIVEL